MDWVPIVFITFKVLALGTGMFFAIKWHYDQRTSTEPKNVLKIVLEFALYLLMIVILFSLIYVAIKHFGLLPAGMDLY